MLISVCVKAKDLTQALHAADMLKSTGRKLDTILYTNLIGGLSLLSCYTHGCLHGVLQLSAALVLNLSPAPEAFSSHQLSSSCPWSLCVVLSCAVCAAVGNADKAFQLYASMKVEGVKSDPQVICPALQHSIASALRYNSQA